MDNIFDDESELGGYVSSKIASIVEAQSERRRTLLQGLNAYNNKNYQNFLEASCDISYDDGYTYVDIKFDALRSCVSTLMSKIAKNKLLPRIMTTNAKWSAQEKSQKCERFIRGLLTQLDANHFLEKGFLDTLLFGDGFVKVVTNPDGDVELETVFADEIHVDPVDAYYGSPSYMFQTKIVSLRGLKNAFPDADLMREDILDYRIEPLIPVTKFNLDENVTLCEMWQLPCGDEIGRHVITAGSYVLLNEEYDKDYFPFIHLQYSKPPRGFFSKGLYQEVAPLQRELDRVFTSIHDSHRLLSAPKIFMTKGSMNNMSRITNEIGEIIEVSNINDIKVVTPSPIDAGTFTYLDRLKSWIFEVSGISYLSATSKMPTGIDGASGKALREYSDIETERFALLAQNWEKVMKDLCVLLLKEINYNGDLSVKYYDRTTPLTEIKFSDLDITIDDISISVYPASSLPQRPEARLATVQEMIQAGFIDEKSALELLDLPDTDAFSEVKNAPKKAVDKLINTILDEELYLSVEPFFDLQYLIEQATLYYNLVFGNWDVNKKKTQNVLGMLEQLIQDASFMLEEANKPEGAPQGEALPEGLGIEASPEMLGMGLAEGGMPIEGMGGSLPPEAIANIL